MVRLVSFLSPIPGFDSQIFGNARFFFGGACHFRKYFLNGARLRILFEFSKILVQGKAALSPSRGRCTRFRSGLATHGVVRDDFWLYLYVLIETVPTVPSSSSPASAFSAGSQVGRSEPGAPARPFSPPPFALTAAQPSPPAPPCACRVQPKHPCIACRTHPARAVPVKSPPPRPPR